MFRTMTSKYAGTCKRCRQAFDAGTRIRYGGPGRTYHLAADCPASQAAQLQPSPLESSADAAGDWAIDAAVAEDYGSWADRADF